MFYILKKIRSSLYLVELNLPLGDIPADDLRKVGQIAQEYGHGRVVLVGDCDMFRDVYLVYDDNLQFMINIPM